MKIFSRGSDTKPPTAQASTVVVPAPPVKPATTAPPAPAGPAAEAPAPLGEMPNLTAIIEANVKEMSEKIARLASTIEGDHSERADFEAKLDKMEERMRKLSALTEMISAQYNPFVGAAPAEREAMPAPDVGLAAPLLAAPPLAPPAPVPAGPAAPVGPAAAATAVPLALDDPFASVAPALESTLLPEPPADLAPPAPAAPEAAPAAAVPHPDPLPELIMPDPEHVSDAPPAPGDARLWSVRPSFGASMLMLGWADMLLRTAPTRDAVGQLLEYYRNIGWIGDPARDQILAYVDGIAHEPRAPSEGAAEWRAGVEVHEKSLLFIEKLRSVGAKDA